jgi:hypothetical protein
MMLALSKVGEDNGSLRGTLSKIINTPVNGSPSLFGIDSVSFGIDCLHQMETSFSHVY